MRRRHLACVTFALLAAAPLAQAQPSTRAAEARAAREAKAQTAVPARPGRVERFLNTAEQRGFLNGLLAPSEGFGIRVGGIDDGGGLAVGPSWRHSYLAGGHLRLHASAGVSIRRDHEVESGVELPHLARGRVRLALGATATELAQEHFYGFGADAPLAGRASFGLQRQTLAATLAATPLRWLEVEAGTALLDTRVPTPGAVAAFGPEVDYVRTRVATTLDYRDRPGNPRSGGRYHVAFERFAGGRGANASFERLDAELEQHLSAWKKQRLLTLRLIASLSDADEGHAIPFYMQRTLGGSRLLRGFVRDRFRDRNLVVVQGEYGWDLAPFLNAVLFYEAGTVAPRARALTTAAMRSDYGVGLRLGTDRTVALRTDVALGSGEGTRIIMRFSHAF